LFCARSRKRVTPKANVKHYALQNKICLLRGDKWSLLKYLDVDRQFLNFYQKTLMGTSIKPVKQGTAQAFFRTFCGGEAKEPKPFIPSTSTSTPQSRPPIGPKENSFSG
jgi:hypothetical protein